LALYGLAQYFGIFQENLNWNADPSKRVFGTIGHGSHFGVYLGMSFLLTMFTVPIQKKRVYRWIFIIGAILQLITLFLTASRGAILSTAIVGIAALIILTLLNRNHAYKVIKKWLLPAFIVLSVTVAAVVVWNKEITTFPLVSRTIETIGSVEDGKIPDRISWWLSGVEMVKQKPVIGWGVSTYGDIYNRFRRKDYTTVENGDMQDNITPETAHNEYLNIAVAQGVVGLLAWLSIIIFVLWTMVKDVTRNENKDINIYSKTGLLLALFVYLIHLFTSFSVVATATIFAVLMGAGLSLSDTKVVKYKIKLKGATKYIVIVLLTVLVAVGFIFTYNNAMAEVKYKDGLVLVSKGDIISSMNRFNEVLTFAPLKYEYYQEYGGFLLKYSNGSSVDDESKKKFIEKAILNYEKAIELNGMHPSTFYNLGVAYLRLYAYTKNRIHYNSAAENFDKAVEIAVNNPLYPYQSGKAFLAIEDDESRTKALNYFNEALEIRSPFRDAKQAADQIESYLKEVSEK